MLVFVQSWSGGHIQGLLRKGICQERPICLWGSIMVPSLPRNAVHSIPSLPETASQPVILEPLEASLGKYVLVN